VKLKYALLILFFLPLGLLAQDDVIFPVYPGCEGSANMQDCFTYNVAEQMVKNTGYRVQRDDEEDYTVIETFRVKCRFTINKKGVAKKISISGDMDEDLRKKFLKNLKRLPKMKPGNRDGFVEDLYFLLPLKIVITE